MHQQDTIGEINYEKSREVWGQFSGQCKTV